jgi:hypothetical protein
MAQGPAGVMPNAPNTSLLRGYNSMTPRHMERRSIHSSERLNLNNLFAPFSLRSSAFFSPRKILPQSAYLRFAVPK